MFSRRLLVVNQRQLLAHIPPAPPLSALITPVITAAIMVVGMMVVVSLLARLERLLEHTGVEEPICQRACQLASASC